MDQAIPAMQSTVKAAIASAKSQSSMDPVKLIASDGSEIIIDRKAAMVSGTIKSMLAGPGAARATLLTFASNAGSPVLAVLTAATIESISNSPTLCSLSQARSRNHSKARSNSPRSTPRCWRRRCSISTTSSVRVLPNFFRGPHAHALRVLAAAP